MSESAAATHLPWPGPPAEPRELRQAQRVQSQLRPRDRPRLRTLELDGHCLPGRALGGDFYDFLTTYAGRLAIVLGDVAGHGLPAALMMANLQASLRTHYAASDTDLGRRIETVNRLFHDCTAQEHYAALFVGEYDDTTGRLRYANCGHVAPWLVRDDGDVERLGATGTVVGMFESWNGSLGEVVLSAGDTLVAVTDGIVEATDPRDGEFGELRLLSSIVRSRHLSPAALTRAIGRDVRLNCRHRPIDDATLVVAQVLDRRHDEDGGI